MLISLVQWLVFLMFIWWATCHTKHIFMRISFQWRALVFLLPNLFLFVSFFPLSWIKHKNVKCIEFWSMPTLYVVITTHRLILTYAFLYIHQPKHVYDYIIYCSILATAVTGTDFTYLTYYCADIGSRFSTLPYL